MDATLLCNVKGASRDISLRLRLLHMWLAKSPNSATVYYHCCLWVDQTGMLIQAIADTAMADDIDRALRVGTIYVIRAFGLNTARNLYRACSFTLIMNITRATTFQECTLPALDFPTDSFEIYPFSELPKRSGFHRILTDVVGRLHSISGVDHQLTNTGSVPKQVLVLQNDQGQRVSITLWNNLAGSLDRAALIQADAIEPVIIAVGSLLVGRQMGSEYSCSSSSGTRISVSPRIPEAYHLATVFGGPRSPVAELPVQFATPEEAVADAANRTKTIAELLELHHRGASLDAKHFCSGIIKTVDSHTPWYYTSCNMCRKGCSVFENGSYWCPKHWEISENQVTVGYKIQLTLRDVTNEAPFIVFGSCGNNLVFTSAPLLAQRYPHRPGQLPPELSALHGQYVKFEAKLPMIEANGVSTGEFRVLRVIPQQNHQIQAAAPLQIQSTMNASHVSQPFLDISHQPVPVSDVAALKQSSGQCSESSPSSSSKGKEKVSGLLLSGTCKPIFRVGQFVQEPQSQSHGSVFINERVASPDRKVVSEVHSAAPGVVPPTSTFPRKETGDSTNTAMGKTGTIAYTGSLQSVADNSTAKLKDPTAVSMPLETSPGQNSSNISGSVSATPGTPQSKITASPSSIVPMSSSTPPFSSPSASLLVSPLAKVKVEKLDAFELKSSSIDAQGSAPFSIGNSGSPQGKRASVKRRLYET